MKAAAAKKKEGRTGDGGSRIRVSLRYKVFLLIAAFVMTVILTFTALEMWQFRRFSGLIEEADEAQDRVIRTTMSNTLEDMTTDSIRQYVRADAQIIDGIFQHMICRSWQSRRRMFWKTPGSITGSRSRLRRRRTRGN